MIRHEHLVQLYGTDERLLAWNVSRYRSALRRAMREWLATGLVGCGHARAGESFDRARFYQQFRPRPV